MGRAEDEKRGFLILEYSLSVNTLLTLLKGVVGFSAGSQALLSDAVHSLSDILSSAVGLVALKIATRPPDANHHYGHGRAEAVGAKIVALLILAAGLFMGFSSWKSLQEGTYLPPHLLVLVMALISLGVKEMMYRRAIQVSREIGSRILEADAKHHRLDALSSLVVVLGVLGAFGGYPWLDPLAGMLVSLLILKMGGQLYWQSIVELVDTAPDKETLKTIQETSLHTQGVMQVSELRARMHSYRVYVDLRICVHPTIPLVEGHEIAHQTAENVKKALGENTRAFVHIDPCLEKGRCKSCPRFNGKEVL